MSEEEFDELLNLMSKNDLTQHGADTLYGEIVSRGINARLEIERLNNRVKQLEKSIMISNKKHSFMTKDNIKLRTIINELEKWLKYYIKIGGDNTKHFYSCVLDKLQELKGSEKE